MKMKIKQDGKEAFLTKAVKATTNATSLRSTIPQAIVKMLGLTDDDVLEWDMKVIDGKLKVVVRKANRN